MGNACYRDNDEDTLTENDAKEQQQSIKSDMKSK